MAKSIADLYEEVLSSESMKEELVSLVKAKDKDGFKEFLKRNNCQVTRSEADAFFKEKFEESKSNGELTPEELEMASGGSFGMYLALTAAAFTPEIAGNVVLCTVRNDACDNGTC